MKKLFSLLFVALLATMAWADTTVVMDFSAQGYSNGAAVDSCTVDNVTATFAKGSNSNAPKYYDTGAAIRIYGGNTMTITAPANLKSIVFTFGTGDGSNEITSNPGNYVTANKTWTIGSDAASQSVVFTIGGSSGHRRIQKLEITMEDAVPVTELVAPVFHPNGGTFSGSLEVTLSCATQDASIYYWEGTEENMGEWIYYQEPFYVTETKTYTAVATKGYDMSDYVTVTFTKETPTCATPTFNPPSGATFMQGEMLSVEISSSTEGAEIWYTVNGVDFYGETPVTVPVDETTTITAFASKNGYNDSEEVTATYTMLTPYNVGGTATFVAETDTVEDGTTAGWHTLIKDHVTMKFYGTVSNYTDNNGNEYHEYRIYKNYSVQFTTDAGNIRKIEFTCSSSNPITGFGNVDGMTVNGTDGTWEGNTRDITFTSSVKQVRATQIVVTLDDQIPNVMAPAFNPAGGYFNAEQEVTITCETEGAAIYYSYDNEQFELYTGPITINEACTIYAYAVDGGAQSETVSATFNQRTLAMNIAEANALPNNTYFYFGGEAIVTYQNSGNTWIKDGTGYGLIYGNQVPELAQGTVLADNWDAQKATYNTFPEYKFPNNVKASEDVVTVEPTEYTTITTANVHEYVIMKDQTIFVDDNDTTGRTYFTADSLVLFNQFKLTDLPTIEEGKTYDVVGMVTIYKNKAQLYIISFTETAAEFIRGDVDDNGSVNITDVTALINYLLSKNAEGVNLQAADCDKSGSINISDVTALINYLLSKNWPAE